MADNETIADIIAWLRRPIEGENAYLTLWRDEIADRLEAAWERERAKIEADALEVGGIVGAQRKRECGDAAKLREALAPFPSLCDWLVVNASKLGIPDMVAKLRKRGDKARAALAAPPRNCDKYATADEALKAQEQMFNDSNFANGECKLGCPECDNPRVGCKIAWLFAPATENEGGNNGK